MQSSQIRKLIMPDFVPMTGMQNCHVMTILASRWRRQFPCLLAEQEEKIIQVAENSHVLVECNYPHGDKSNIDSAGRSIAVIMHGLEGSSRSHYVMGLAEKLLANGISTARVNMRNCGGTMHLTDTLYNAGLSADLMPVSQYFLSEGFENIFLIGFSLGGNVVLKGAAEISKKKLDWLKGVCAVSPSLDLPTCVSALEQWYNRIYEVNFLLSLKQKIVDKNKLQRGRYDVSRLSKINSVRGFDDFYTAPDGGYASAEDYYEKASALPMIPLIDVPVLILAAQDDPMVPFSSFRSRALSGDNIHLITPAHGGHAGFVGALSSNGNNDLNAKLVTGAIPPVVTPSDRFWAEKCCSEFCSRLAHA